MRTVDLEIVEGLDLGVLVHAQVDPTDPDWQDTVERWERFARRVRGNDRQPICLVVSPAGQGPNARQRRLLDDINAALKPRVAVATASSLSRGIVTAISWFGHTDIRSFSPDDLESALTFLGIGTSERDRVERAVSAANRRLIPSRTGT